MISVDNLTFLKDESLMLNEKAMLLMNYLEVYEILMLELIRLQMSASDFTGRFLTIVRMPKHRS